MRSRPISRCVAFVVALAAGVGCGSGLAEYEARALPPPTAGEYQPGVYVTWLGTAGVVIDDGDTRIIIDPFITRYSMGAVLFGRRMRSDVELVERWLSRAGGLGAAAVVVTHSHYDHAMDAPTVASRTGAVLVGSADTMIQARAHRLDSRQLVPAQVGVPLQFGRFTVTLRPSTHGDPELFRGHTSEDFRVPARARDYRTGDVYSVLIEHPWGTLLHHGSAARRPETYDETTRADVVLLGLAGRDDTRQYLHDVVDAVGATRVIPMHFDDFFRPLDHPMKTLRGVRLAEMFETTAEHRPDLEVQTLPLGEPRRVFAAADDPR